MCSRDLPKPNPGSTRRRERGMPARSQAAARALEEGAHFADDIVVMRRVLHRPGLALHVHQASRGAAFGDGLERAGRRQRRHVVHERCAGRDRAAHHRGLARVDGNRNGERAREALDERDHAPQFLLVIDRRARPAASTRRPRRRWPRPPRRVPAPARALRGNSRKRPPSEKESGVTLSTPMTTGRSRSSRKRPHWRRMGAGLQVRAFPSGRAAARRSGLAGRRADHRFGLRSRPGRPVRVPGLVPVRRRLAARGPP